MTTSRFHRIVSGKVISLWLMLFLSFACKERNSPGTLAQGAPPPPPGVPGVPVDTVSPHPVMWDVAGVKALLSDAGLPSTNSGPVSEPFSSAPGNLLATRGAELEVFIYADAGAVARETDIMDKMTTSNTGKLHWDKPPAVVVNNNLVVIIRANDDKTLGRLRGLFRPKDKATDHR